jgi:hypothetical protein
MDDEMFHRYQQTLIDEAATTRLLHPRDPTRETGGLVRWI